MLRMAIGDRAGLGLDLSNLPDNNPSGTTTNNEPMAVDDAEQAEQQSAEQLESPKKENKQRFEIVKKLGSGTYGKVSLAYDHKYRKEVRWCTALRC